MRYYFIGLFFITFNIFSQEIKEADLPAPMIAVDSLYREDQFYFAFTYNVLTHTPSDVSQNKFSPGFKIGFLRDFPTNKKRNVAIAPGLGISYLNYFQSLFITKVNGDPVYSTTTLASSYKKNKFEQLFIDIPIEFRWRTSKPVGHKFWRIYSGVQLSYLVYDRSVYIDNLYRIIVHKNKDYNKFQPGIYLAAGNNSWNFYAYYGLLPIFKSSAQVNNELIKMHTLNLGLMFYIL